MEDVGGLLTTLEHYVSAVLGTRQADRGYDLAFDLATKNVHSSVQLALGKLGHVTVLTDEDIGDISCIYQVEGQGQEAAVVFISTVLPYAAVIMSDGRRYSRFASMGETAGFPGAVVACLTERGLFVLPDEACRAKRPAHSGSEEPFPSYFEDLFQDEFGPPEDWYWVGDPDPADEGCDCP